LFVELYGITPRPCEELLVPWQNDVVFHPRVCGWFSQTWANEDKFHQPTNDNENIYCH
jgi:hypothetical protein